MICCSGRWQIHQSSYWHPARLPKIKQRLDKMFLYLRKYKLQCRSRSGILSYQRLWYISHPRSAVWKVFRKMWAPPHISGVSNPTDVSSNVWIADCTKTYPTQSNAAQIRNERFLLLSNTRLQATSTILFLTHNPPKPQCKTSNTSWNGATSQDGIDNWGSKSFTFHVQRLIITQSLTDCRKPIHPHERSLTVIGIKLQGMNVSGHGDDLSDDRNRTKLQLKTTHCTYEWNRREKYNNTDACHQWNEQTTTCAKPAPGKLFGEGRKSIQSILYV